MPKVLSSLILKKGEVQTRSSRGLLALRWRDKKDIFMLSTKHLNANMVDTGKIRSKKRSDVQERIIKPNCVIDYNQGTGGVDRQDPTTGVLPHDAQICKRIQENIFLYV